MVILVLTINWAFRTFPDLVRVLAARGRGKCEFPYSLCLGGNESLDRFACVGSDVRVRRVDLLRIGLLPPEPFVYDGLRLEEFPDFSVRKLPLVHLFAFLFVFGLCLSPNIALADVFWTEKGPDRYAGAAYPYEPNNDNQRWAAFAEYLGYDWSSLPSSVRESIKGELELSGYLDGVNNGVNFVYHSDPLTDSIKAITGAVTDALLALFGQDKFYAFDLSAADYQYARDTFDYWIYPREGEDGGTSPSEPEVVQGVTVLPFTLSAFRTGSFSGDRYIWLNPVFNWSTGKVTSRSGSRIVNFSPNDFTAPSGVNIRFPNSVYSKFFSDMDLSVYSICFVTYGNYTTNGDGYIRFSFYKPGDITFNSSNGSYTVTKNALYYYNSTTMHIFEDSSSYYVAMYNNSSINKMSYTFGDGISRTISNEWYYFGSFIPEIDNPDIPPYEPQPDPPVEPPSEPGDLVYGTPDIPQPEKPTYQPGDNITINVPTVPVYEPFEGMDYSDWLDEIVRLLREININLVQFQKDVNNILAGMNSNLVRHMGNVSAGFSSVHDDLYWLEESLNDGLESNAKYIVNAIGNWIKWLSKQLQFDSGSFSDKDIVDWLKKIYSRLGGNGISKPDPTTDGPGFWDWLLKQFDDFFRDLFGGAADKVKGLFDELKGFFPFSVPWDLAFLFGLMVHEPVVPVVDLPLPVPQIIDASQKVDVHIDCTPWDGTMRAVRAFELVIFAFFLARMVPEWFNNIKVGDF